MEVYVYSSAKKTGYYLYLAEKDKFEVIPETLKPALGPLSLALTFDLHADRKLAKENAQTVLENIEKQGFHLQISDPLLYPDLLMIRDR